MIDLVDATSGGDLFLNVTGSVTQQTGDTIRADGLALKVSGTRPGRISCNGRANLRAMSCAKLVAPIFGIDNPPLARTIAGAVKSP